MKRLLLLPVTGLFLVGCTTTIGLPREDRTRVYQDDFDTVFKAAAGVLRQEGYLLFDIDYLGGVLETDELFDVHREEFTWVQASVSEWEDGTHLLLIYYLEKFYTTVEEAITHCDYAYTARAAYRHKWCGTNTHDDHKQLLVYTCDVTVTYWDSYLMPKLARSQARAYYDDLFAKVEAAMAAVEPEN